MQDDQIYLAVKWRVIPGNIEKVLHILDELSEKSLSESGNILYNIHQSVTDPNEIHLYEIYKDENALELHKESLHYQQLVLGQIIPLLEVREVARLKRVLVKE